MVLTAVEWNILSAIAEWYVDWLLFLIHLIWLDPFICRIKVDKNNWCMLSEKCPDTSLCGAFNDFDYLM